MERYEKIFAARDALMRFLAEQGVVSLVDRATGYINTLEREALARLLDVWITENLQPYVRTFSVSWFNQLCRLKGIEFGTDMELLRYVGKLVNDLVWNRPGPGVRPLGAAVLFVGFLC